MPGSLPAGTGLAANSIEEMLVSLAQGVREAQETLNSMPQFDTFGRPAPGYFIPQLDFEFEVEMEVDTNGQGAPVMKMRPTRMLGAPAPSQSQSSSAKSSSRISGRLVAIPPGNGLPMPQLVVTTSAEAGNVVRLDVTASNSSGERLAGQLVEINPDMAASEALAGGARLQLPTLSSASLTTDEAGRASTRVTVPAGSGYILVAQMGAATARVLVRRGG